VSLARHMFCIKSLTRTSRSMWSRFVLTTYYYYLFCISLVVYSIERDVSIISFSSEPAEGNVRQGDPNQTSPERPEMSHPVPHSETGTHWEKLDTTTSPTSGKKIHSPGCRRSQGRTRSPASNPYYQTRKGLDLDPAIEETKKSRNFVINFPFRRIRKQLYIPKIVS